MAKKNSKAANVAKPVVEEVKEVVTVNEPEVIEEIAETVAEEVTEPEVEESTVELEAVPEVIELDDFVDEPADCPDEECDMAANVDEPVVEEVKVETPKRKTVCTNPEFRHGFGFTWNGME